MLLKKIEKTKSGTPALSSGSTLLNLACTDSPFGAFLPGKYYFIPGDSTSGKTFLSMTCFAETVLDKNFQHYRLIYDNVEDGMLIDLEKLFNKKVADKVEAPSMEDGMPVYSFTVEEFYFHVDDAIQKSKETGIPFLYVLDSMDSLSSDYELEKFDSHKTAHKKGTTTAGSYGDGKARKNSEGIRKIIKGLRETNSILIVLAQTRDSLGFGFETKTRSGGHALRFYATVEIWTSVTGKIQKTVNGVKRNVGINIRARVKKNRITGMLHEVPIIIYPSYGIDDIGSCVDWLVSEKWWENKGGKINATEFEIIASRDKVISIIEEQNLTRQLQKITGKCWNTIQEQSRLKRKKRYDES